MADADARVVDVVRSRSSQRFVGTYNHQPSKSPTATSEDGFGSQL